MERLKEVEAAVNLQTMEFLEKKRNQLQDEVDAWEERQASPAIVLKSRKLVMSCWFHVVSVW